jgi:Sulfotransferase domain
MARVEWRVVSRPNFFIVGAPKCGTTALSEYLRGHPRVFVSRPKEPHFFGRDLDYYFAPGQATLEHYLALFDGAGDEHLAVGEASVWYLYSRTALAEIREFAPEARIVVMVRDPVELVPSLHSQLRYMLDEDEPDLERAWALQHERAAGRALPSTVRVPAFLQYGEVGRLGDQLERALATFPREQVHVIVFDDLRGDAGAVYRDTLEFLGVPDDGRRTFARVNENKVHRTGALARLTQRPPRPLVHAAGALKRATGVRRLGVLERVRRRNRATRAREAIDARFAAQLRAYFAEDVAKLGELIGRDLSAWTRGDALGPPGAGAAGADPGERVGGPMVGSPRPDTP